MKEGKTGRLQRNRRGSKNMKIKETATKRFEKKEKRKTVFTNSCLREEDE